jgi:hypothetical protein
MPLLSLKSLIALSKKNKQSQEEFPPPDNDESQNTDTNAATPGHKRPRITFDDDYNNDSDHHPSRPSLSFRELGMADSAATPSRKRRKSKTPLKKKSIKRSDSDDEDENVDRPRITFDDDYDNDNDNRPSQPSLSF